MNFKARGRLHASPEGTARFKLDPIRFETSLTGECQCHVSDLSGRIGAIPIHMSIPFLKPRRHLPLVATIGGFNLKLKAFDVNLGARHIHAAGTLGTEGLTGETDARMKCEMEGEVEGILPFRVRAIHLDEDGEECKDE